MRQTPRNLTHIFREFAERVCHGASPLYEEFATRLSEDPELLSIAEHIRSGQPANLFFAAVHYLLLKGADHPLAKHYPSIRRERSGSGGLRGPRTLAATTTGIGVGPASAQTDQIEAYSDFRSFCLEYREQIVELISKGYVQTNEVGRYACMLQALLIAAEKSRPRPLALIEIGASAGLGLIWDLYHYRFERIKEGASAGDNQRVYGALDDPALAGRSPRDSPAVVSEEGGSIDSAGTLCWGSDDSSVKIRAEVRGAYLASLPDEKPLVAKRVGIDLQPIDLSDSDRVLWLRSFIFPEQAERDEALQSAARLAIEQGVPQMLTQGDAVEVVPDLLRGISEDAVPCIFNSFALSQIPPEGRSALLETMAQEGRRRTVFHVSLEWLDTPAPVLSLTEYDSGRTAGPTILARCDPHGRWLDPFPALVCTS